MCGIRCPFCKDMSFTFEFKQCSSFFHFQMLELLFFIWILQEGFSKLPHVHFVPTKAVFQHGLKRTSVVFIIKTEVFWSALTKFQHRYLCIIFPNFHLLLCTKYFVGFFSYKLCLFEISQNIWSSFPNCNPGNNYKLTLRMFCINYLAKAGIKMFYKKYSIIFKL